MSATLLDVAAVRARFSALAPAARVLRRPGRHAVPGRGDRRRSRTTCAKTTPTSARRTRRAGARTSSSRTPTSARPTSSAALPDETAFGPSMTALNFLLTRALRADAARGRRGRSSPRLDHDGNVSPWLELAHDLGIVVRVADLTTSSRSTTTTSSRQLSERTRVVAFPVAANSVGTAPDVRRIVELAHSAGALAWADAVHYGPHGPIDVAAWDVDVLICSPYKFFGPHMGLAFGKQRAARVVAAVQGSAGRERARRPPLRARDEPARAPRRLRRGRRLRRLDRLGRDRLARARARRAVPRRPPRRSRRSTACRRWTAACRRSASTSPGRAPRGGGVHPRRARLRGLVGNYYALETMPQLGLDGRRRPRGHRALQHGRGGRPAPRRACGARVKLLSSAAPFPRPRLVDAALARGHEVTIFNRAGRPRISSRTSSGCRATATATWRRFASRRWTPSWIRPASPASRRQSAELLADCRPLLLRLERLRLRRL